MSVSIIKFSNGDEVITRVDSTNDTHVVISRPRQLVISGDRGGLMPYIISAPDAENININRNMITAMFDAPKDVADGYMSTTSGILLG